MKTTDKYLEELKKEISKQIKKFKGDTHTEHGYHQGLLYAGSLVILKQMEYHKDFIKEQLANCKE